MAHIHDGDAERVLLTEEQIRQRVRELGEEITRDYEGKSILAVGVLKGAVVFFADLVREINVPVSFDFMVVSSYGSSTKSSGVVQIVKDLSQDIAGKHILIIEDILDSGMTLNYLMSILRGRNPASIEICALLDKPERRKADLQAKYKGFTIPDAFVIGYGLDYDEVYRNMPYIGILKPEVYTK